MVAVAGHPLLQLQQRCLFLSALSCAWSSPSQHFRGGGGRGSSTLAPHALAATPPPPEECAQPYTNLTEPWRSTANGASGPGGLWGDDKRISAAPCLATATNTGVGGGRWYRFALPPPPLAGNHSGGIHACRGSTRRVPCGDRGPDTMPLRPPGSYRCGTAVPGWLSGWAGTGQPPRSYDVPGSLPLVGAGVVNGTACFDYGGGESCHDPLPISIVACVGFWLRRLPYTSDCGRAYCAAPAPLLPPPPPPLLSCLAQLKLLCSSARRASAGNCYVCCGQHQSTLRASGCTQNNFDQFCSAG